MVPRLETVRQYSARILEIGGIPYRVLKILSASFDVAQSCPESTKSTLTIIGGSWVRIVPPVCRKRCSAGYSHDEVSRSPRAKRRACTDILPPLRACRPAVP